MQSSQRVHSEFSTIAWYCSEEKENHSVFIQAVRIARYISTRSSAQLPEIESVLQFLGKTENITANNTGRTDSNSMSSVRVD